MGFKKLLIIGFVWPEPNSSAAGSRMMQLISFFQSQNYIITFVSSCVKTESAFNLESIGVSQQFVELNNSSFDGFLKDLKPDVVLFDRFLTEEQFGWRVHENCPNAIRILDTEDLHGLRKGRTLAYKANKPFNKSFLFNDTSKREIASIYRSDLSLIISKAEMEILKSDFKVNDAFLLYLPFLLDEISDKTIKTLPIFESRKHFVTIGNFLHEPNYQAVLYLKEAIWPRIKKALPQAEMHIYGAYASQKVNQLNNKQERFFIKGYAEDAHKIMQNAKVCLAPLQFGAGLKGKLIDAMQNGTPCVMSSIAAEGMFGNLAPNGFIEDNPETFAEKAVQLYNDNLIWNAKQKNGFQIINTRFNKNAFQENFAATLYEFSNHLQEKRLNNFTGQMLMHHTMQSTKFMSKWIEAKNVANN
ncbi:glycosyltransferase [Siansivirga zeaxanthinifaciens]|uniref:Glycosyltransferase n=1 Tax=Siansivirga zeaxanthinifaciens CC-SAMT-1 TaxID=1454006 RepID=A0A0C5WL04_9FLAO|nr:glycosyltransferase [Siansivirga zeaxanthinifaciens]AJR03505.1 glycosyltransferase [Siansivirga zeaxanthinifaciens CC-SAMT-1]